MFVVQHDNDFCDVRNAAIRRLFTHLVPRVGAEKALDIEYAAWSTKIGNEYQAAIDRAILCPDACDTLGADRISRLSAEEIIDIETSSRRDVSVTERIRQVFRSMEDAEYKLGQSVSKLPAARAFACRNCGSSRVHRTTVQNRSGDEGMDCMIVCLDCHSAHLSRSG